MTAPEIVKDYQLRRCLACSTLRRIILKALHTGTIQTGITLDECFEGMVTCEDVGELLCEKSREAKSDIEVTVEWDAGIE